MEQKLEKKLEKNKGTVDSLEQKLDLYIPMENNLENNSAKNPTTPEETAFTIKEVSQRLEVSTDLLRKWEKEFNLQIERVSDDPKAHRRYYQKDINLLNEIRMRIQEQNMSYKMVRQWINGDEPLPESANVQSNLDKKLDKLLEQQERSLEYHQNNEDFNKVLLQIIAEQKQVIESLNNKVETLTGQVESQKTYIETSVDRRDKLLMDSINKTFERKREEENNKGFFKRLLGK